MSDALTHSGRHFLAEHLQSVSDIAGDFSAVFQPDFATQGGAYLVRQPHDLKKYRLGIRNFVKLSGKTWSGHVQ